MASEDKNRDKHFWLPKIVDLKSLFGGCPDGNGQAGVGFPDGSRILISGPPGSGKTFFALALVRALMREDKKAKLIYISTEHRWNKLEKDFTAFNWFQRDGDGKDSIFSQQRVILPAIPELGPFHEARGASSLVDLVLKQTRHKAEQSPDQAREPFFVLVDSLSAILKDSRTAGERRLQAYKFLVALSEACFRERPALIFLLAEQPLVPEGQSDASPEQYVADIVMKLSLKGTGAGRRLRTMEVSKSHGTKMLLGEHTFAIVGGTDIDDVIAQPLTRELVENTVDDEEKRVTRWGTIIIAPRPHFGPIGKKNSIATPTPSISQVPLSARGPGLSTGTAGLDAMLFGGFDEWAAQHRPGEENQRPGLQRGSMTLILGSAGTGKTTMCLQFLLRQCFEDDGKLCPENAKETLYVNFENEPSDVVKMFPGSDTAKTTLYNCNFLYRRRGNLDVNLLILELSNALKKFSPRIVRVVIDGLSDLLATTEPHEYSRLIEALVGVIRHASQGEATTLISYEMPPNFQAIAPPTEGLSIAADNIIVLRHLPISDELQKTICVLKARGQRPDRQVREVVISDSHLDSPLSIGAGRLELYSNLLAGDPKPLEVHLHLFAENIPEQIFNAELAKRLSKRFGHDVREVGFSRPEITRTLEQAISPASTILRSDISVISLDEWWIREYGVVRGHSDDSADPATATRFLRLDTFFTRGEAATPGDFCRDSRSDYWAVEIEKASLVRMPRDVQAEHKTPKDSPGVPSSQGQEPYLETLAVPNYQDFGLFCVNQDVWNRLLGESSSQNGSLEFPQILRNVPRRWVRWDKFKIAPPDPDCSQPKCLVDLIAKAKKLYKDKDKERFPVRAGERTHFIGFAFDMETTETAVCAYLEFCWSFGAKEGFLMEDAIQYQKSKTGIVQEEPDDFIAACPATKALLFLQYLVEHNLMPARTTVDDCRRALFSRQFYSTLCELAEKEKQEKVHSKVEGKTRVPESGEVKVALSPAVPTPNDGELRSPLIPLVFFPVAAMPTRDGIREEIKKALYDSIDDAKRRFERVLKRVKAALHYRDPKDDKSEKEIDRLIEKTVGVWDRIVAWWKDGEQDLSVVKQAIDCLRREGETLKKLLRSVNWLLPGQHIPVSTSDRGQGCGFGRDLWFLLPAARSLDLRDLQELLSRHEFRLDLIEAQVDGRHLADVIDKHRGKFTEQSKSASPWDDITALTGYGTTGSWMVGVLGPAHSPRVAWDLVEEITSLKSAVERSRAGAGIPSRKDFFEFYGNEKVKHVEHLTWHELLKFAGSHARRRDKTVCAAIRVTKLSALIYRNLMYCLAMAKDCSGGEEACGEAREEAKKMAAGAVKEILGYLQEQMRSQWKDGQRCPYSESSPFCSECMNVWGKHDAGP